MTDQADKADKPATTFKVVDTDDAVVTYRSLRIAMVAATALLAAAILQLWVHNHRNFEGSISAYYYTVAHGVFIAAICALGICLIAYKGHSPTEDVLLDVAGILAFVVAFVPTKGEHILDPHLPTQVNASAGVTNNIWALLIAIAVGFGAYGFYVTFAERDRAGDVSTSPTERDIQIQQTYTGYAATAKTMVDKRPWLNVLAAFAKWSLPVVSVAIAVTGFLWFLTDPRDFSEHAHGRAAAVMFGSLTVVVLHYAVYAVVGIKTDSSRRKYAWMYLSLGVVMLVTVVLAVCAYAQQPAGGVKVFSYEVVLLGAFTAFWLVQTWDLWNHDPYADTPPGDPHHSQAEANH
jgi:cytochrome bd-type quinol oxidase subunit 2